MSRDATALAKRLQREGWTVEHTTDRKHQPHWTATHPDAEEPITWNKRPNIQAALLAAAKATASKGPKAKRRTGVARTHADAKLQAAVDQANHQARTEAAQRYRNGLDHEAARRLVMRRLDELRGIESLMRH